MVEIHIVYTNSLVKMTGSWGCWAHQWVCQWIHAMENPQPMSLLETGAWWKETATGVGPEGDSVSPSLAPPLSLCFLAALG